MKYGLSHPNYSHWKVHTAQNTLSDLFTLGSAFILYYTCCLLENMVFSTNFSQIQVIGSPKKKLK